MELRSILDWQIAPRLRSVPGVVEVNSFGGELKTYEVQLDPDQADRLRPRRSTRSSRRSSENNANAGGAYIARDSEQVLIRGEGLIETLDDIRNIVVATSRRRASRSTSGNVARCASRRWSARARSRATAAARWSPAS